MVYNDHCLPSSDLKFRMFFYFNLRCAIWKKSRQKETKQQLVQMVQHNRLSHALLFLGKEGVGALPLAFGLAQYVVCEKVQR